MRVCVSFSHSREEDHEEEGQAKYMKKSIDSYFRLS